MHIIHLYLVDICVILLYIAEKGVEAMAIRFKVDVLAELKAAGFTSYRLRNEKLMGESTRTKIRAGGLPSWHELDVICKLLKCQPGDLVEYVEDSTVEE